MSLLNTLRAASPARQAALALVGFVVIAGLMIAGYFLFVRTPYAVLFTNLRTADAATIVADLDKKKIPYRLKDDGATILVPENLKDTTRLSVTSEDLPLKGSVGFELFNKSDMGLTEFAQKINYQRALQGELARTIMSVESVETARVHLTLSDPTIFREDRRPSKASVSLKPREGRALSPKAVEGVQRLVAAAVPDLEPSNVVVLDEGGAVVSSLASVDMSSDLKVQERSAFEQYYTTIVRDALEGLYTGRSEVTVVANVFEQAETPPAEHGWKRARTVPLSIEIALADPPAADVQQRIKAAVTEAARLDPAQGDVILLSALSPSPSLPTFSAPTAAATASAAGGIPALSAEKFWELHLLVVFVLLFIAGLVLMRLRPGPRRLTARERVAYAQRLKALLANG